MSVCDVTVSECTGRSEIRCRALTVTLRVGTSGRFFYIAQLNVQSYS